MYNIRPTTKFQKDLKRVKKRGFDIPLLTDIIKKLAAGEPLPEKNRDHQLSGDYAGCRECHITPDCSVYGHQCGLCQPPLSIKNFSNVEKIS